jgi:hydrogenase maturation protease
MSTARVLVAGVGNIFLGDDAFGVEVVRELARRPLPAGVRVADFGIRGLDLTLALLDGYEAAVVVDATPRGGPPGTLYVLEVEPPEAGADGVSLEGHNLDPARVFRLAASLGSPVRRLIVVGCEPGRAADTEEMAAGLSDPVRATIGEAARLVEEVVGRLLAAEERIVPTTEGEPCRN